MNFDHASTKYVGRPSIHSYATGAPNCHKKEGEALWQHFDKLWLWRFYLKFKLKESHALASLSHRHRSHKALCSRHHRLFPTRKYMTTHKLQTLTACLVKTIFVGGHRCPIYPSLLNQRLFYLQTSCFNTIVALIAGWYWCMPPHLRQFARISLLVLVVILQSQ